MLWPVLITYSRHLSHAKMLVCSIGTPRPCLCSVVMKHPIDLMPQFKLFQPNVLLQMPQNIVLELVVGGLAPMVNNPANVKTYAADMSRSWASHHTIQAISAECPPPDASEHCIRTCCWWSGPYSEQPCKCKNLCCRHVSVMGLTPHNSSYFSRMSSPRCLRTLY